jgi:hypothetical protein
MRHTALRAALLVVSLAAASCAGQAKSPPQSAASSKPQQLPEPPSSPRERLVAALRAIPRPEPVLAALPVAAQQRLETRLAGLDAERRLAVHGDDSPLVESLPLLHLVSGGTSPRALYALATTSAGSEEMLGLGLEVEPANAALPEALQVSIARELAQRAALNFLRDRAADAATSGKGTALVCRLVARAAQAVGHRDVLLLARELLAEVEPNSDNRLDFAKELARGGDPEGAARVLAEVRDDKRRTPRQGALPVVEQLIESARVATAPSTAEASTSARLTRARAWLRLGRVSEARAALEPDLPLASTRLDLAAAVAETRTENPACPDLPPDVGNATLCALAFESNQRLQAGRALLEAAWNKGAGRDDEAIEVYVALEQVLPWLHETAGLLASGALSAERGAARIAALRTKIQDISAVAPWLQGLSLFLETVHSGAPGSASGLRSEAEAQALSAHALSLAADPHRFAQAGVLAVAATLSHQQDISPLIDALPFEQVVPALHVPRAGLEAWAAVTSNELPRMEAARSELATIMATLQGGSLDRARLVLAVSEADALFDTSQRSYQLLSRVVGQLLSDNIPPDLALRAVIDAAGALAHGSRFDQAQKLLAGAASAELPPNLRREQDLLQLIRGYQLVLGVHGARADALPRARTDLAALAAAANGDSARVWFELWARELEAMQDDVTCAKKKLGVCRDSDALRRETRRGLDARLGAAASAVLLHGALPSGAFDAGFRFTVEGGLEPLVSFDPSFLAIGLPKFAAD